MSVLSNYATKIKVYHDPNYKFFSAIHRQNSTLHDVEYSLLPRVYSVQRLILYVQNYSYYPLDLSKYKLYVEDIPCNERNIVPIGCTLHIVHKSYKRYKITLQKQGAATVVYTPTLKEARRTLNQYIDTYKLATIDSLYWDGNVKKRICQKVKRSVNPLKQKVPNRTYSDHQLDIKLMNNQIRGMVRITN
jgi:hypothetical protein